VWFAAGANALMNWQERRWPLSGRLRLLPVVLVAGVALYSVVCHYPEALTNRQTSVRSQAQAILDSPLPEGALVVGPWGAITPLRYLQRVENVRPDLWIIQADAVGVSSEILPAALADKDPLYVLRTTEQGIRLLPLPLYDATAISHTVDLGLGGSVRWRGYDLPSAPAAPGEELPITLYWEVKAPIDQNWKTFIHLLDDRGEKVAQVDRVPLEGLYPPVAWEPGRWLADQYELLLPATLPAGRYHLIFGWYDESERLHWEDGQDSQQLGEVDVRP
jgi:hypothetical protein